MATEQGSPGLRAFSPGYRDISQLSPERLERIDAYAEKLRRCDKHQRKAARALEGLRVDGERVVQEVRINEAGSDEDMAGHDLTLQTKIGTLYGQVKSSDMSVRTFRTQIGRRLARLGMNISVNEYLAINGMFVLNGKKGIEAIRQSFLTQYGPIAEIRGAVA